MYCSTSAISLFYRILWGDLSDIHMGDFSSAIAVYQERYHHVDVQWTRQSFCGHLRIGCFHLFQRFVSPVRLIIIGDAPLLVAKKTAESASVTMDE